MGRRSLQALAATPMGPRPFPNNEMLEPKGVGAAPKNSKGKSRAPEQTFEEVRYLKYLIDNEIPVRIKLSDNEEISGTVEYYDATFIRVTRRGLPNLFIYKHDIKYIYEED